MIESFWTVFNELIPFAPVLPFTYLGLKIGKINSRWGRLRCLICLFAVAIMYVVFVSKLLSIVSVEAFEAKQLWISIAYFVPAYFVLQLIFRRIANEKQT